MKNLELKRVKKLSLAALVCLSLSASLLNASGIPVVDAAANAQMAQQNAKQVAEWLKEANRWVDTASHYQKQLDAYAEELAKISGVRDIAGFMKEVEDIYKEGEKLGTSVFDLGTDFKKGTSNDALSKKAKALADKFLKYDYCKDKSDEDSKNLCSHKREKDFEDIVYMQGRSKAISQHTEDIQTLAKKLKQSKDIKESADIQNAIQTKVALLNAEKIQIDLYNEQRAREDKVIEDLEDQRRMKIETNFVREYGNK